MKWVSFWRKNPHRFVEDYLGIRLHLFQKILIYMINKVPYFMYIASRGQGKSFIIAVYSITRCILYPNTKIIISSKNKTQANLIINAKIVELYHLYDSVRFEIGKEDNIATAINDTSVTFKNGSTIKIAVAGDGGRGLRANVLIVDEFIYVDFETISKVLRPFLTDPRATGFRTKDPEKYKDYIEDNTQIYLSSAGYKTHWSWDEFQTQVDAMLKRNSAFIVAIPYQASVYHGNLTQKFIDEERAKTTFDEIGFEMEYGAQFIGQNVKGYYNMKPVNDSRTVTKSFIPPTDLEFIENNRLSKPKKISNMPRQDGEIRLVGLDVALLGGSKTVKNDSSAFTCLRMMPDKDGGYVRHAVYLESIKESIESENLAIRLKQLYYDFESDYAVIDAAGNGLGIYDACAKPLYDSKRDVEYEAWSSINDEELQKRYKINNGKPVLYTYKGNAKLNSDIAVSLRSSFDNGKLRLLINDIQKQVDLLEDKKFVSSSPEEKARILFAYRQTTALANELISLEYDIVQGGNIKISAVGTTTKDRFSSLSYTNHAAQEIERNKRKTDTSGLADYFFITNNFNDKIGR